MRCIQDMIVSAPKDGNEFRYLLYTALEQHNRPFAIRYPKSTSFNFDKSGQVELLPIGSWETLKQGKDIAVLAVGSMVNHAMNAAIKLNEIGISCEIINCRFIKPMDIDCLNDLAVRFKYFLVVEEGVKTGGFGEGISSFLTQQSNHNYKVELLCLPDSFVEHGPRDILLERLGLSENGIFNAVKKAIKKISTSM